MEMLEREQLETNREFRYALMRWARAVGQLVYWAGIIIVCIGCFYTLLSLPNILTYLFTWGQTFGTFEAPIFKAHPYLCCFGGMGILAIGFLGIAVGTGMMNPYQYATAMPSTYIRVCHSCGKPLQNEWIIYRCHECGKFLPMGLETYLVRMMSKWATIAHVIIALTAAAFFLR